MAPNLVGARGTARTLLIDADDTLWENNIYFLQCTARFQRFMRSLGCPDARTQELLTASEHETISQWGYGPAGYIEALGMACERWLELSGQSWSPDKAKEARALAEPLLDPPMVLMPHVKTTLARLQPTSTLVLVTKGDRATQERKLARSGLAELFDAQYIVDEKTVSLYRDIVRDVGASAARTWMIGNSPKSDINPAVEAGLNAIYIPHDQTWTAEHQEIRRPDRVVNLARFADLIPFFGRETDRPG